MAPWGQALQELTCISFLEALGKKVDQHPHFADGNTEDSKVGGGVGSIRDLQGHTTNKWQSPDLNQHGGAPNLSSWPGLVYVIGLAIWQGVSDDAPTLTELRVRWGPQVIQKTTGRNNKS